MRYRRTAVTQVEPWRSLSPLIESRSSSDTLIGGATSVGVGPAARSYVTSLVADDDRGSLTILHTALSRAGLDVISARDGNAAWDLLSKERGVSLAVLDWMMPGTDGLELCKRIRQDLGLATMYVILLTGRNSRADVIAGLEAGADDYIVKPFDLDELQARVRVGMRVAGLQERLASQVAELRTAHDTVARLASIDFLTGLWSRRRWFELATSEADRFDRYRRPFSVLMADLDFFKRINDTFGHTAGDQVLEQFAGFLKEESRHSDVCGRIGGEEFAVLLPDSTLSAAEVIAARIVERCRAVPIHTTAGDVALTCSIGVAEVNVDDQRIETLLQRADAAMYAAKQQGRNRVTLAAARLVARP
jgi:two-component system cell cycle response regulator